MSWIFLAVAVAAVVGLIIKILRMSRDALRQQADLRALNTKLFETEAKLLAAQQKLELMRQFEGILDVQAHIATLQEQAKADAVLIQQQANAALDEARSTLAAARAKAQESERSAAKSVADAMQQAQQVIADAKARAQQIAGDAYAAMGRADELKAVADAMTGVIRGFGDQYLAPTYSLLDDLAEEWGHSEVGDSLKRARDASRAMATNGTAATCEYAEANRRQIAIRFVLDAFNGKVDSILSRVKSTNHGKLEAEIRAAYALVNLNGAAFRNARILEPYLDARLAELKWAASAQALREQDREEQRRLREQIREEERARREFERAIKDAEKEEDAIKKAMEKVQAQVEKANAEQRAEFEAKLLELQGKLQAAEEKNQRALSMAQQTKSGHVYVISNAGSFGENVYKIGMTRRLEPSDRVRELGDASVPFAFDIHAMVYSSDAPALEHQLHRHFLRAQVNKVNPRKEFFRIDLAAIRQHIEGLDINVHWTMTAEAAEWRETQRIEQQLRENPAMEADWERHQMALEAETPLQAEEDLIE